MDFEKDFDRPLVELLGSSTKEEITANLTSFRESLAGKIAGYETTINSLLTKDWK